MNHHIPTESPEIIKIGRNCVDQALFASRYDGNESYASVSQRLAESALVAEGFFIVSFEDALVEALDELGVE